MANVLKHRFASGKANGPDATQIQPSHWNDGHLFSGGNAGDLLTRDPTDASFGAKWGAPPAPYVPPAADVWKAYTVLWTASGTAPAVGNGTLEGAYLRNGNICFVSINLRIQSTTTGGSGTWFFSLPMPTITTPSAMWSPMLAYANRGSGGQQTATGLLNLATNFYLIGGGSWGAGVPAAWGAGDFIYMQGWIPVAP